MKWKFKRVQYWVELIRKASGKGGEKHCRMGKRGIMETDIPSQGVNIT